MSEEKLQVKTAAQWFKEEIAAIKPLLPKNYKIELIKILPKSYDNYRGGVLISNVLSGKSSDMVVLKALKQLVNL